MFLTLDSKFLITRSVCSNEGFLELSAAIIQGARVRIATMFDTHCSLLRSHIIPLYCTHTRPWRKMVFQPIPLDY
ncbi:unnamed protein product [Sphagnum troendelagicum]|uniref:Uncharacterized protein n=1 Tax=Sphagnum troendelagicum TaxID=128251 RepID=A0ABP0U7K2_9BRYO